MRAGPVSITGSRNVKIDPIEYQNFWKGKVGFELASVRLRSLVEVLTNFDEYFRQSLVGWRGGATFLKKSRNPLGLADPSY